MFGTFRMSRVAKAIASFDGQRRVDIFERGDGTYYFVEMRHYHREEGDLWSPLTYWSPVGGSPSGFYETLEIAELEVRSKIAWLKGTSH
jgi:hypothetical protein